MNKASIIAMLTMIPVFTFVPITDAQPEGSDRTKEVKKLEKPLKRGDKMPAFTIQAATSIKAVTQASSDGGSESTAVYDLTKLLEEGPVVVTFYRGSWCPYCRGELSAIQDRLDKITQTGARVLAISPEQPLETVDLVEQKHYGFLFGTDHDNALAKRLALAFTLDKDTVEKYIEYGIDLPESNGTDTWQLPIPATYVVDTDGTIRYAFIDQDYTKRADYDEVLRVLRDLQKDG